MDLEGERRGGKSFCTLIMDLEGGRGRGVNRSALS